MEKKMIKPDDVKLSLNNLYVTSDSLIRKIVEKEDSITVTFKGRPSSALRLTISKDTITDWYDRFCEGGAPEAFKTMLEEFNGLLPTPVERESLTWRYLLENYKVAEDEWKNNTLGLFSASTYPEIYPGDDYRGTNDEYEDLAHAGMHAWLMFMCLEELVPTSGITTNNQTELLRKAYELGGGNTIPLYGGYTLKGDPMIARLAAGAVYSITHDKYRSRLHEMRTELGGGTISAASWEELGYTEDANGQMTACGYLANTDVILPGAPGPFADGKTPAYPEGQDESLFYDGSASPDWRRYNYLVDVAIDEYITANYRLFTENSGSYDFRVPANATEKEVNRRVIEAATIPLSADFMYFGKKRIKYVSKDVWHFDNLTYVDVTSLDVTKFFFAETNEAVEDTNNVYDIESPFSALQDVMFNNPQSYTANGQTTTLYSKTSHMLFLGKVMNIADNSRYTTMFRDYGRRRPLGGTAYADDARVRNRQEDPLNGINSGSLTCLFADTASQVDTNSSRAVSDDFPHDKAKSYVSGHSAQAWTLAMYLGQMKPDSIVGFMEKAYRFSVNRSVGRFHWNSDCMYGRLFGTIILPILNAMDGNGWQSGYEAVKRAIGGGGGGGDWGVTLYIDNQTGSPLNTTGEVRLYIRQGSIGINMNLPGTDTSGYTSEFTFSSGENGPYSGITCEVNGGYPMLDEYDGEEITSAKFYVSRGEHGCDYAHCQSPDVNLRFSLVTGDSRCDSTLKKSGAVYVLRIENA